MPKTNGLVVGIDPGKHCGWAALGGKSPMSGTWILRDKGKFNEMADLSVLRGNLNELARETPGIELCVMESGFARGDTDRQHNLMRGVVIAWCIDFDIRYKRVAPTELKKWATGSGKATKSEMVEAATAEVGGSMTTLTEDEADAILCALWGQDYLKKEAE